MLKTHFKSIVITYGKWPQLTPPKLWKFPYVLSCFFLNASLNQISRRIFAVLELKSSKERGKKLSYTKISVLTRGTRVSKILNKSQIFGKFGHWWKYSQNFPAFLLLINFFRVTIIQGSKILVPLVKTLAAKTEYWG